MLTRGVLMGAGSLSAAGLAWSDSAVVEIHMRSDADGGHVGFDPVGLLIQPGQTLRWICDANYHTTVAYHPANGDHSDWYQGRTETRDCLPVPPAARAVFPAIADIVRRNSIAGIALAMGGMHGGIEPAPKPGSQP
jgi:hypothetical protein